MRWSRILLYVEAAVLIFWLGVLPGAATQYAIVTPSSDPAVLAFETRPHSLVYNYLAVNDLLSEFGTLGGVPGQGTTYLYPLSKTGVCTDTFPSVNFDYHNGARSTYNRANFLGTMGNMDLDPPMRAEGYCAGGYYDWTSWNRTDLYTEPRDVSSPKWASLYCDWYEFADGHTTGYPTIPTSWGGPGGTGPMFVTSGVTAYEGAWVWANVGLDLWQENYFETPPAAAGTWHFMSPASDQSVDPNWVPSTGSAHWPCVVFGNTTKYLSTSSQTAVWDRYYASLSGNYNTWWLQVRAWADPGTHGVLRAGYTARNGSGYTMFDLRVDDVYGGTQSQPNAYRGPIVHSHAPTYQPGFDPGANVYWESPTNITLTLVGRRTSGTGSIHVSMVALKMWDDQASGNPHTWH